ncbi:hypothetical protein BDP27DRAFT_1223361 [Rhodocollybia butyracea]|uniref:NmrA-like domain-containing protein n=1 Tax=Rhodocollybia butyracea TaxID=206335 RepID=A0A9P5PN93_9AGAR|nr:hypothetical protein BDP27DRAFT_1223361 [Rhodocollybia butyracea]
MSRLTSFALIGSSGYFGSFVVSAFAQAVSRQPTIIVLSRNPESKKYPSGVKVVRVDDYEDVDAIAKIFVEHQIDAVVSTVGYAGITVQKRMADAAKKAGVKLFAPSEFGSPTDDAPDEYPDFQEKDEVAKYIEAIGLPCARFYNGAFINSGLFSVTGVRVNGKVNVIGRGQSPVSFTLEEDVAGFVAYVLTSLTLNSLSNKIFRLEGDRASLVELANWYGKEVSHVEEIPGRRGPSEILSMLAKVFEAGACSTGWNFKLGRDGEGEDAAGSANKIWQGHQWKAIRDVIMKL